MTFEDIINFASDNHVQLTVSVDPDPLCLLLTARKGGKKVFQGLNVDILNNLNILNKPWEDYIQYELTNMLRRLEESKCHTS